MLLTDFRDVQYTIFAQIFRSRPRLPPMTWRTEHLKALDRITAKNANLVGLSPACFAHSIKKPDTDFILFGIGVKLLLYILLV